MTFDARVFELVQKAHSDNRTAPRKLLAIAVEYLRARERLPDHLADYLADAFEVASHKGDQKTQLDALGLELGLKALNRRPTQVSAYDVEVYVSSCIDPVSDHDALKRYKKRLESTGVEIGLTKLRFLLEKGREARRLYDADL